MGRERTYRTVAYRERASSLPSRNTSTRANTCRRDTAKALTMDEALGSGHFFTV
jgi:hypothetical protein